MSAFQITLILVFSIGVVLWLIFRSKNQQIKTGYAKRISRLNTQMEIHTKQVFKRNQRLNQYDFTKYNLTEALVVQAEIQL